MICGTVDRNDRCGKAVTRQRAWPPDWPCTAPSTRRVTSAFWTFYRRVAPKGAALDILARIRGLESGQIMAIGDNLNDLEMLEYAGHARW